jgi:hypothetical protein
VVQIPYSEKIWSNPTFSGTPYYDVPDRLLDLNGVYSYINWNKSSVDAAFDATLAAQQNETKLKALVKIADAKVNVAVTLAEAHKTSDLILDAARRIDRAYRAFRKGNLKGVAENLNITPRRLHKSWLEYKYGWMPLLMDVKGAAEFFAQQHVVRSPRFKVSASNTVTKTYPAILPWSPMGTPNNGIELWSCTRTVKVVVWCELSSPHLSELQQLGLTNPALIAWELIPFSFVFDWFVQVGDWLTGLTALQGVTVIRAFTSYVEGRSCQQDFAGYANHDLSGSNTRTPMSFGYSRRYYVRTPLVLDPSELYPPMTNSFDFKKLVTSLALIQGTHRGNARL